MDKIEKEVLGYPGPYRNAENICLEQGAHLSDLLDYALLGDYVSMEMIFNNSPESVCDCNCAWKSNFEDHYILLENKEKEFLRNQWIEVVKSFDEKTKKYIVDNFHFVDDDELDSSREEDEEEAVI